MGNRKQSTLSNESYIFLTVGSAIVLMLTTIPADFILGELHIPVIDKIIYYEDVMGLYIKSFPILSLLGAWTTIRKKKTLEDVFINLAWPLVIWLLFRFIGKYLFLCLVLLAFTLFFMGRKIAGIMSAKRLSESKKVRFAYYECRKTVYLMLFVLGMLGVHENYRNEKLRNELEIFYQGCEEALEQDEEGTELELVSEEEWEILGMEDRTDQMTVLANYYFKELGMKEIPVYVAALEKGMLGLYSTNRETAVYISDDFLKDCNIADASECLLHEIHHYYQDAVIQTLLTLKEENADFMNLQYYKDALGLAVAQGNYSEDYTSWETYQNNELEVQSRTYAAEQVEVLRAKFGWEKQSELPD